MICSLNSIKNILALFSFIFFLNTLPTHAEEINQETNKTPPKHSKDWEDIAKERAELELLVQKISLLQKSKNQELDVLLTKKTDLESENSQLKTNLEEAKKNHFKTLSLSPKNSLQINIKEWELLLTKILQKYDNLTAPDFLNYHQKRKTITSIKDSIKNPKESIEANLTLLLSFFEKELKEAKSFDYLVTELMIENKLNTVELVRMGEVLGYYKTAQQKTGIWFKSPQGNFIIETMTDHEGKKYLEQFILDVKNQKKWGLHENLILPKKILN